MRFLVGISTEIAACSSTKDLTIHSSGPAYRPLNSNVRFHRCHFAMSTAIELRYTRKNADIFGAVIRAC